MAITSWTDLGMVWDDLTEKQLYPYAEALRLALKERWEAFYTTSTIPAPLDVELATGVITTWEWVEEFQDQMTALIAPTTEGYVNHNDSGGDWTNVSMANFAPLWTEATMMTQIGDASRIVTSENGCFRADWALQQYKMLNELYWYRNLASPELIEGQLTSGKTVSHVDWATCVANFNAAAWEFSLRPPYRAQHHAAHGSVGSKYYIERDRAKYKYESPFGNFKNTWKHKLDAYSGFYDNDFGFWLNNDYAVNEDAMFITSQVVVESLDGEHIDWVGNFDNNTMPFLAPWEGWNWETTVYDTWGVSKWNVTDGFDFVLVTV